MKFKTARFLLSATSVNHYPNMQIRAQFIDEVAIVGRSNVGKSSLINHLFQHKSLAKVSSVPGKTQTINFFLIDEKFLLVDLPGYGFAKVAKNEKTKWNKMMHEYFFQRPQIKVLLVLLDSRRDSISVEDKQMIQYGNEQRIPILFIVTKCDKLNQSKRSQLMKNYQNILSNMVADPQMLTYSIKEGKCRFELIQKLHTMLKL